MAPKVTQTEEPGGIQLKEFSIALGQIAEEKGISQERVIETVEAALSAAYKKDYGKRGQNIRAEFDPEMGEAKFFLVKEVVDETTRDFSVLEEEAEDAEGSTSTSPEPQPEEEDEERLSRFNAERDITLEDAKKTKKDVAVGDVVENELESYDTFGRVAAQTAKQVIIQKIREAEREAMYAEFKEREGEVISGTVERVEGRTVYVTVGRSTGVMFPGEQSQNDRYRIGQRLKVYVVRVESDPRGPGIILSRADKELVSKLFALEVPEIFAGTVEVKAIAREAGVRTKMAVSATEEGIDPIGSCVGQKGTRVQAVIDELGGEKIDIIEWNDDPKQFLRAAISPAKVVRIEIDEEAKTAQMIVPEDQLSLAIGRQGQNVRLASKVSGYQVDVMSEEEATNGDTASQSSTDDGTQQETGDKKEAPEEQEQKEKAKKGVAKVSEKNEETVENPIDDKEEPTQKDATEKKVDTSDTEEKASKDEEKKASK